MRKRKHIILMSVNCRAAGHPANCSIVGAFCRTKSPLKTSFKSKWGSNSFSSLLRQVNAHCLLQHRLPAEKPISLPAFDPSKTKLKLKSHPQAPFRNQSYAEKFIELNREETERLARSAESPRQTNRKMALGQPGGILPGERGLCVGFRSG